MLTNQDSEDAMSRTDISTNVNWERKRSRHCFLVMIAWTFHGGGEEGCSNKEIFGALTSGTGVCGNAKIGLEMGFQCTIYSTNSIVR